MGLRKELLIGEEYSATPNKKFEKFFWIIFIQRVDVSLNPWIKYIENFFSDFYGDYSRIQSARLKSWKTEG